MSAEGRKMDELIASMYPVNIPSPSKVGDYTYAKFVTDTPSLIQDNRHKRMIIQRSEKDVKEFKEMRLKADLRNPPISESGMLNCSLQQLRNIGLKGRLEITSCFLCNPNHITLMLQSSELLTFTIQTFEFLRF